VTAVIGDVVEFEEQLVLDAEAGDFYGLSFSGAGWPATRRFAITVRSLTLNRQAQNTQR
jgi:hypothetical protein